MDADYGSDGGAPESPAQSEAARALRLLVLELQALREERNDFRFESLAYPIRVISFVKFKRMLDAQTRERLVQVLVRGAECILSADIHRNCAVLL